MPVLRRFGADRAGAASRRSAGSVRRTSAAPDDAGSRERATDRGPACPTSRPDRQPCGPGRTSVRGTYAHGRGSPTAAAREVADEALPDRTKIRNVALVGHGGAGKTTLAEALLHRAGAITRDRAGSRTAPPSCDFDPEEQKRGHLAVAGARPVRVEGPQDQPASTRPATPTSWATSQAALRVADLAVFVVSAVEGVEVQTEAAWRDGRRARRAPHGLRQQARPGAGLASSAPSTSCATASAPASRRSSCPSARRPAFRGVADLLTDTAYIYDGGDGHARRRSPTTWRRSSTRCTTTWSRASSSPTTSCSSATSRATSRRVDELEHTLAHGVDRRPRCSRSCAARPPTDVGDRPPGRLHLRDRPVARSTGPPVDGRRPATPTVEVAPDPDGQPLAVRVQDDRRPVRRPALAVQGAVGHDPPRRPPRQPAAPAPTSGCTACSRCGARSTSRSTEVAGRRHRRGGQAGRHRHRRHARPEGHAGHGRRRSTPPDAGARHRRRGPHPGRRGQAGHRAAPPASTRTRRCVVDRDDETHQTLLRGHGRDPPADHARAAGAQVRRRRRHRGRAGAVPGDHHRRRPRPRASTRSRRGGHGQFGVCAIARRAARAGRRLRVRRQDRRRRHPPPVHPRRAEGHRGGHGRGRRATASRSSTCGSTLLDGKYHPVDSSEMASRSPAALGLPRGDGQGRPGACSSRSRCSRSPCPTDVPGRRDGRPQRPPGPGAGHRDRRRRRAGRSPPWCRRRRSCATPSTCARSPAAGAASPPTHDHYDVLPAAPRRQGAGGRRRTRTDGTCDECGFYARLARHRATRRDGAALRSVAGTGCRSTRGLKGEDLDALLRAHPLEGTWSALEYACHIRDVLAVAARAVRDRARARTTTCPSRCAATSGSTELRYNEQDPVGRRRRDRRERRARSPTYVEALTTGPTGRAR